MTDRARSCYALLRTLFAWTPAPRSRTSSAPGFIADQRLCLNCKTSGKWDSERKRRIDAGCLHCGGTGTRPVKDVMDDPIKDPPADARRKTGFGGRSGDDLREARYRRDEEIERLGLQLSDNELDAPTDYVTRAIELRDLMYRHGSYADLEVALALLRAKCPGAYQVCMSVAYAPFDEEPIEPVHRVVVKACELLAHWMPEEIRVPSSVPVFTKDELERHAREARDAMAWGHSEWARASRAERKRAILLLRGEGLSDGKIASRFGLSRSAVQKIRAGIEALLDESNGHEEAA